MSFGFAQVRRQPWCLLPSIGLVVGLSQCARADKTRSEKTTVPVVEARSPGSPSHASAAPTDTGDKPRKSSVPSPPNAGQGARCMVPAPDQPPAEVRPAESCPEDPTGPLALSQATVSFPNAPNAPGVRVELARDDPSRTRGLMYRTNLPEDAGMLFSWPDSRRRSFWMKNTCIPLDMLFIDDEGYIVGILENVPTLNLAARNVACPAQHVLEVNAGWTRKHGVFAGQKIVVEE